MKRFLTTLLATAMCSVSCLSPIVISGETDNLNIRGDINQDGKLNTLDLLNMKRCLLGVSDSYNIDTVLQTIPQFDVNADGKVSTVDLLSLKRILLGLDEVTYIDNNPTQITQETETYTSSYISMTIPKGWKVQEGGTEMDHTVVVYDESNPQYQIFVRLKAEPILKSKASKEFWQYYSSSTSSNMYSLIADAPYVENATISDFYSNFNDFAIWAKAYTTDFSNANLLSINNFDVITEYDNKVPSQFNGSDVKDCKTLVASFNDDNGNSCKGLFSGTMVNFGDYIQELDWFNDLFGTSFPSSIDTSYYMIYDVVFITTPSDKFDTDAQFLASCLNTLQYSSEFVDSTNQNIQDRTDYFNEVWS